MRTDPGQSLLFTLNVSRLVASAFRPNNAVGPRMLGLKKLKRTLSQDQIAVIGWFRCGSLLHCLTVVSKLRNMN